VHGAWRFAGWLTAFFLPDLGLLLGLLYAPHSDGPARRFGRICLVLALLGWLAALFTGWVSTALGNGEGFIQSYY
jgi:hypothetical protein